MHFSKAGIRVNAIAPGFFVTKQNEKLLFDADGNPTPRTGKILAATPMGRFGKAEELSGAVLFLLNNEAASFITGVVLPIDGGFWVKGETGVRVFRGPAWVRVFAFHAALFGAARLAAAANRKAAPSVRFCCAPMSPSQSRRAPRPSGR